MLRCTVQAVGVVYDRATVDGIMETFGAPRERLLNAAEYSKAQRTRLLHKSVLRLLRVVDRVRTACCVCWPCCFSPVSATTLFLRTHHWPCYLTTETRHECELATPAASIYARPSHTISARHS